MDHAPALCHAPCHAPDPAQIAALIDLIGRDSFARDLAQVLAERFGCESFHIFLYRKAQGPVALANYPDPPAHARGLKNYLSYTHVINPAYRASQQGHAPGVYMISDFYPKGSMTIAQPDIDVHIEDNEPIGYRTPGWPKNMAEVIVLISLPNDTALDFSFLTPLGSPQATACHQMMTHLFPVLDAVLQRQFAINPASLEAEHTPADQEDRFQDFGGDTLTAREREVAQLILIGHSSGSISLNLGISLPTVKTHRRNIYSKLQISSQAELFSLFLLHLK
ncbi:helix-turn-helix transcriptional regulator [Rhodobacteraceae bacterium KMM 6894]|nr:helix-turn-helix transcriptional regulator [Rhodobacteraceae bacterium KMM 6894]